MTCWPGFTSTTTPELAQVTEASDIIRFWFEEIPAESWFTKDPAFDQQLSERFMSTYQHAARGECAHWRETPLGRLAEIIVLDQFPRNMFREQPAAFATDNVALVLSQEAVAQGVLDALTVQQQPFLIMPYMHSESPAIHEKAMILFSRPGLEHNLDYEIRHKAIIDRFGRYPHRNEIVGRESTPDELAFLEEPGSSF